MSMFSADYREKISKEIRDFNIHINLMLEAVKLAYKHENELLEEIYENIRNVRELGSRVFDNIKTDAKENDLIIDAVKSDIGISQDTGNEKEMLNKIRQIDSKLYELNSEQNILSQNLEEKIKESISITGNIHHFIQSIFQQTRDNFTDENLNVIHDSLRKVIYFINEKREIKKQVNRYLSRLNHSVQESDNIERMKLEYDEQLKEESKNAEKDEKMIQENQENNKIENLK